MIIASLIVDDDTDSDAVKIGDKIQAYWTSVLLRSTLTYSKHDPKKYRTLKDFSNFQILKKPSTPN